MKVLHKQRGQVAVFYALLIPIVFVLGSMGLEFGWYYLNVSRLQNAADAAVLVGAKALVEQEKIGGEDNPVHGYKVKLVEKYPANAPSDDFSADIGHAAALAYAKKNLADNSVGYTTPSLFSVAEAYEANATFKDGYSRGDDSKVTLQSSLYKNGEDYYYVVGLSENVQHFFIRYLDDMNAGVVAVALISKNAGDGGYDPSVLPNEVEVVFNANGGTFDNGKKTSDPKSFKSPSQMADDEFSNPITPGTPPTNSDSNLYFKGWSTSSEPDENGIIINFIIDGKQLSKIEMQEIFGDNTEVTLYAVWGTNNDDSNSDDPPEAKPQNNKTLWEQMQYLIAKNVYPYYWYSAVNKYGQDPINNRFNNVKVYYGDGSQHNIYHEGYYTTETTTERVWVGESWEKTATQPPGKENDDWKWVETDKSESLTSYWDDDKLATQPPGKEDEDWRWVKSKKDSLTSRIGKNGKTEYGYYQRKIYGYYLKKVPGGWVDKPVTTEVWHEPYYETVTYSSNNRNYFAETIDLGEHKKDGSSSAPSPHYYDQSEIATSTHYFIDFWQADGSLEVQAKNSKGDSVTASTERSEMAKGNLRIHSLFNVSTTYAVRPGYGDDPLYCRIEAEPYVSESTPIRQIVINVNADNTGDNCRPLFIFYDGPDARRNMANNKIEPGQLKPEEAQPIILNLNADFKGVLFVPDIPVIINGNNYKFEGFIIAKEYRYLDTSGAQVQYSSKGKTDQNYTDNKIRVDKNGNVLSIKSTGESALALWNDGNNPFGLNQNSCFKMFKASAGVNYAYIHYDFDTLKLDMTPFYDDLTGQLIDIQDVNGKRISKWEDVKLFGEASDGTLLEIPKEITLNNVSTIKKLTRSSKLKNVSVTKEADLDKFRGIVLLDSDDSNATSDNKPIPIYDAYVDDKGNRRPIYFCESYVKLSGSYNVITLDKMTDGTRSTKEFLLTKTATSNISNTDDWT